MASRDYYAVIGVPPTATSKDISKAFRAKARKLHPDKQAPDSSASEKLIAKQGFQELAKAYEVLGDASQRREYDAVRAGGEVSEDFEYQVPSGRRAPANTREWETPEEEEYWDGTVNESPEDRRRREKKAAEDAQNRPIGSHWVKPTAFKTPPTFSGWTQSGVGAKRKGDDDASDASSELSFEFTVDFADVNLDDLVPINSDEADYAEAWIRKPAEEPKEPEAQPQHIEKEPAKTQPQCCAVQ